VFIALKRQRPSLERVETDGDAPENCLPRSMFFYNTHFAPAEAVADFRVPVSAFAPDG
jgi:hypothetical protein